MPFPAQELLRCPVCSEPWETSANNAGARSLVCVSGHRFDAARQGYVNFLTGRGTRFVPDTAEMVAARERFLGAGHYAPIAEAVAEAAAPALSAPDAITSDGGAPAPAVLDAGAGTGYYLGHVLGRSPGARAVALDLSRHALARAAKLPGTAAIVWDLWRDLPLPDRAVDVVLDIFAPRNVPEFARVLRRGGVLCIVTPRPEHLAGLRDLLPMLDVPAGKADAVARAAEQHFDLDSRRAIDFPLVLDREAAADLALMGPAGHHMDRADILERLPEGPIGTAGAVELSVLRRH
ncbi:methyltransferase domain-containing protein [Sinomonas sp. JGH33]|uniref:Methyltransferase domain-containing protein n=1 Tax=Sinomonas terricola TaxID=3110330 RepID=A0ABU5T462_9MICC|nr:methyltransferase domain-containing protein [Sinomonas sp. JGH33]MEA5454447.1 methyltransferase domain-containing protein [Sinomonas sp. JGH33]